VKVLAMSNRERAKAAPDIPTVVEAGAPALLFDGLVGLYGPPGMPQAVRERIAADIRDIASDPVIVSRMTATGQALTPGTPVEMAASIEEQRKGLVATAQILGVKPAQ
jgi:tripartite-type tricarboxylate transporter receptor subunit TctC